MEPTHSHNAHIWQGKFCGFGSKWHQTNKNRKWWEIMSLVDPYIHQTSDEVLFCSNKSCKYFKIDTYIRSFWNLITIVLSKDGNGCRLVKYKLIRGGRLSCKKEILVSFLTSVLPLGRVSKKKKDGIFHLSPDPPTHPPKMEKQK